MNRVLGRAVALLLATGVVAAACAFAAAPAQAAGCVPRTGPYQRQVERMLGRPIDGRASVGDCLAVRRFQLRMDIRPALGYAGPLTFSVATRLHGANYQACGVTKARRVCLDLTHQVMWFVNGGRRVYGPVPVRTGRRGKTSPDGVFRIQDKKRNPISTEFKGVHLPYWERYYRDMGFHKTTTWLYDPASPGSHGCVNLLPTDAVSMWRFTRTGTSVHIFGRKPGT